MINSRENQKLLHTTTLRCETCSKKSFPFKRSSMKNYPGGSYNFLFNLYCQIVLQIWFFFNFWGGRNCSCKIFLKSRGSASPFSPWRRQWSTTKKLYINISKYKLNLAKLYLLPSIKINSFTILKYYLVKN